jgi:hypothetical protein
MRLNFIHAGGSRSQRVLKRVCTVGFIFFFLKGLAWLALGGLALTGLL